MASKAGSSSEYQQTTTAKPVNSAKLMPFRVAYFTILMGIVFWAAAVVADGSSSLAGDLQAARQVSLERQLSEYRAQKASADRKLTEAMQSGSPALIEQQSALATELGDRIRGVEAELAGIGLKTAGSPAASSRLEASAPSFSAVPSGASGFKSSVPPAAAPARTAASVSTPSYKSAPATKTGSAAGLTPPTITKLNEASKILTNYEEFRAEESGMGRRGGLSSSTPSFSSPSSSGTTTGPSAPPPGVTAGISRSVASIEGDIESLAMRREMGKLIDQQQDIGLEADALQRQIVTKQREQAALLRMDQGEQADALQAEITELTRRALAAQSENARIQQASQQLADQVASTVPADGVVPDNSGLQSMGRAGSPIPDDGRFKAGDKLQLIVTQDPSFNGTFDLLSSGVVLPNLGRVEVIGMNSGEAERAIKAALEASFLRQATVTVERIPAPVQQLPAGPVLPPAPVLERYQIIYLAGEFITPGPLRIPDNVRPTLLQTIIRSGGITPSGDLTRVKLLRIVEGQGAVEEINVSAILSGEIKPSDIVLQDGDIIVIPPFAPVVYVTGNVERPGTLRLFQDETLTAYAAILRAGGFARFANLKKVYVVRDLGNGEKAHIPLNIKDVQRGEAPDIILQGKDIVVVPERFFSF